MPTILLGIVGLFSAFAYIISCMLLVSGTDHRADDQLNKQAVFTSVGGAICVAGSLHFISG